MIPEVTWKMMFDGVDGERCAFGGAEILAASFEKLKKEIVGFRDCGDVA